MSVEAQLQQAYAAHQAGALVEAEALYHSVLAVAPEQADALECLASLTFQSGRMDEAISYLKRLAAQRPEEPEGHYNLALCYLNVGRARDAADAFERARTLNPNVAAYFFGHAEAMMALGDTEGAVPGYQRALALEPSLTDATTRLSTALLSLGRHAEAAPLLARLQASQAANADVLGNYGVVQMGLEQYDAALAAFERALALEPHNAKLHLNRGLTLMKLKRPADAAQAFERALTIDADQPFVLGEKLHSALAAVQWRDYGVDVGTLEHGISLGKPMSMPFQVLAAVPSAALQLKAAQIYAAATWPRPAARSRTQPGRDGKVKVAVLSSDFRTHAVASLVVECLERMDRARFELYGIDYGPRADDAMRQRLRGTFHHFIDVRHLSDQAAAEIMTQAGVHIAVDLNGHTDFARTGILALRPAPVQVNYLGHPGTTGTAFHDYIIADRHLIPASLEQHYSERVVRLPHTYQPNQSLAPLESALSRRDVGLEADAFVFCCFNGVFKITPQVFDSWARILKAVPKSVLWLLDAGESATANLKREALARGISPHRLAFAKFIPPAAHLQRYSLADVFLDTWPYNAHTTASDSLRMGLPVLTYCGEAFAARVAASLLRAVNLPEMITTSIAEYETLAVRLAEAPEYLAKMRRTLQSNLPTAPLFDAALYTRHFEQALLTMFNTWRNGEAPQSFDVPAA